MRHIVISDTHLTHQFDASKCRYLSAIISSADRIIINGDFWDGYITTFDAFVHSPWKKLFPLLKRKRAVYLFGNHDKEEWSNKQTALFSVQAQQQIRLDFGKYQLHIEHGHRIAPTIDIVFPFLQRRPLLAYAAQQFDFTGVSLMGDRFLNLMHARQNGRMKRYVRDKLPKHTTLLCGHSHLPELSLINRFANSGFILHGYASYLHIERGTISLVRERY